MEQQKIYIRTFGCQMNKLDSELAEGVLTKAGHRVVSDIGDADIILYNTCSVRGHAEEKVYSHIGALKARSLREHGLIIGVLGCMAQKDGERIFSRAPHVRLVCGTQMMHRLPALLKSIVGGERRAIATGQDRHAPITRSAGRRPNRLQAFVSIMRGCDNYCTYCIVPYVRGREVSRRVEDIVEEVEALADDGCREVTLLGQNVNSYGKGLNGATNLAALLRAISSATGIDRIRFVTSHPKDMTTELLEVMRDDPKICKYLHLPAQAGSDKILSRMNRRYTGGRYRELIETARDLVPDISVSSDFIVGFPGETNDDFNETVRLVNDIRFFNCFVFKYSPRKGTSAERLEDDVTEDVKRERNCILLDIQKEISSAANRRVVGRNLDVLVEGLNVRTPNTKSGDAPPNGHLCGNLIGRSQYNHIVAFEGDEKLIGEIAKVNIHDATNLTLFGNVCW